MQHIGHLTELLRIFGLLLFQGLLCLRNGLFQHGHFSHPGGVSFLAGYLLLGSSVPSHRVGPPFSSCGEYRFTRGPLGGRQSLLGGLVFAIFGLLPRDLVCSGSCRIFPRCCFARVSCHLLAPDPFCIIHRCELLEVHAVFVRGRTLRLFSQQFFGGFLIRICHLIT